MGQEMGEQVKLLESIMRSELKDDWKLDIKFDWKIGWEGEAFGDGRCIMVYVSEDVDCFGPFLHELAHAIDIENRGERPGIEPHDVQYADILTQLMIKYMEGKKDFRIIN